MKFRTMRRRTALAAAAALALSVTACGGGGSSAAGLDPTPQTPVTVQAGFIPVIDVAALYLGDKQGFFTSRGIKLNVNTAQGGAALVPPVVSGQYQFAFSNIVSVLSARAQGLPLKVIASGSNSTAVAGKDVSMIRVPENSTIKSPADLAGKKVSVNTLNNLLQMLGDVAVSAAGGDPASVKFVELPFPDAVTALGNGNVDAMVTAEPFDTIASKGTRVIASPYLDMAKTSLTTSVYFTSEQQLQQNPKLFTALKAAIDESLTYANAHPDQVRAQLPSFMKIDPAVVGQVTLPTYAPGISKDSVDAFVKAAKRYNMVTADVSYDDLVWSGAAS
ncbi:ABC transporter substrate-binding protein [Amycolatopsis alkalitolerans]|uniref:Nitrate ABC transporter substrate-binding protein n=1 Tax=Amycolatopsis alkalitolerans TaxID=2547244 RepID=A0A5C4M0J0_9PSEU|nr:ABC transporter substrate-binding protein [Amycolatopsis alkalitolerans]TNC25065.1 nitrate ABC transporter substrate-binding protein [Amycolatopsis alkalitolerans]